MSTTTLAAPLPRDLLERLSLALESSDQAQAIRAALSQCPLPEATRETVLEQALLVGQRAREREPRASASEVQLSLGVVLVLWGATSRGRASGRT